MRTKFKTTRIAVALMIAASLVAPSANAGGAMLPSTPGNWIPLAQFATTAGVAREGVILADHRSRPRANGNTSNRRDFCRAHPHRCNITRDRDDDDGRDFGRDRGWDRGWDRSWDRGRDHDWHDRRITRDDDRPRFRRGYRGERSYRRGYRQHDDGWWYPLAAFTLGVIILNELNDNRGYSDGYATWSHIPEGNMYHHDTWCDRRYLSYSRQSKTFQPYHGPRQFCNSPYDLL